MYVYTINTRYVSTSLWALAKKNTKRHVKKALWLGNTTTSRYWEHHTQWSKGNGYKFTIIINVILLLLLILVRHSLDDYVK
jgi:hypothetical protein